MRYFDLHCDTLYRTVTENGALCKNDFHISFEKAQAYKPWIQCMAVWIPDTMRGQAAFDFVGVCAARLEKELQNSTMPVCKAVTKEDITRITAKNGAGVLLTVEGGAALAGKLANIKKLKTLGVRMLTLTWNGENEIGFGCLAKSAKGIKPFGKAALKELEAQNIIVDVSHAGDALFYDIAQLAKKPFVASHSNARSVCAHPRNLTDAQFITIRDNGGLVGVNFCRTFLCEDGAAKITDIVKHTEHFLSLGGENTLCIGSDFDGTDMPQEISSIADIGRLYECFLAHNYNETLLQKIFFENAVHFCENFDNLQNLL